MLCLEDSGLDHIILLVDASGSMAPVRRDVVAGVNNLIESFRGCERPSLISLVFFDDKIDVAIDCESSSSVRNLPGWKYKTLGLTRILDAIGETVERVEFVDKNVDAVHRPARTYFFVITDGCPNGDRLYSPREIKSLIRRKRKDGWEFFYLGTDPDTVQSAKRIGIGSSFAARFLIEDIESACLAVADASSNTLPDGKWKDRLLPV